MFVNNKYHYLGIHSLIFIYGRLLRGSFINARDFFQHFLSWAYFLKIDTTSL